MNELKKVNSLQVWLVGLGFFFVTLCSNAKRWQVLLQFEALDIGFLRSLRLSLIGIFFNFFMPGGVGGDVVKAGYLMRLTKTKRWFIGWSILVDRVFGLIALLIYSGVTGLLFAHELKPELQAGFYTMSVAILIGFAVMFLVLVLSPKDKIDLFLRSHPLLEKVVHPLYFFFHRPQKIIIPLLLSLVSQGFVIAMGVFLVYYTGQNFPFWMVLLIFPFGFLATILPISPAGLGVGQAAFYYLFKMAADNGEFGVLMITFFQAVQFLTGIIGGLIFVLYKKEEA